MKRILGYGVVGLTGLLLSGCPIYPENDECFVNADCRSGYYCSSDNYCVPEPTPPAGNGGSGPHNPAPCVTPSQCGSNETCGSDGYCHSGDCFFSGCVSGYECVLQGYYYTCVPKTVPEGGTPDGSDDASDGQNPDANDSSPPDGGDGASPDGDAGDAGPVYCGNPADCPPGQVCSSSGTCQPGDCTQYGCVNGYHCVTPDGDSGISTPTCQSQNPGACIYDIDCADMGVGFRCISGLCTPAADQCTDRTQCPFPDTQNCVDGKCVTSCTQDAQCPEGYHCNETLGVCTDPASPCQVTQDCADPGLVCVAGACVPHCSQNTDCPAQNQVCVSNGCVPSENPDFVCTTEGQQGSCSASSICLHHNCYLTCTPSPDSCAVNPPNLAVCKSVSTSGGQFNVCGSNSNLGSECDPTTGHLCASGKVCIDGFCR